MRKIAIIFATLVGMIANYYYNYFFYSSIKTVLVTGCRVFSAAHLQKLAREEMIEGVTHLQKIKHRILEEDFVKDCSVKYEYPDKLLIEIVEKTPIAKNIENSIVALDDSIINSKPNFNLDLIKVAGVGYELELKELIEALNDEKFYPELCIFIRPGRWNLLYNNKMIKLPEYRVKEGVQIITKYKDESWFEFAKEIDLRKPGYAIVQETNVDHQKWLQNLL